MIACGECEGAGCVTAEFIDGKPNTDINKTVPCTECDEWGCVCETCKDLKETLREFLLSDAEQRRLK